MTPLLSVVIANYNYGRFIGDALQSLLSQSCDDFEIIVVDGGSTDESVSIIKEYEDKISWWVSEKDNGQSDAFNKGFARASGRFFTWLNADDVMLPGTIENLKFAVSKNPSCEWFIGGAMWLDKQLHVVKCGCGRKFSVPRAKMGNIHVWGPSSFFSRNLYERAGKIDERFVYMMDTDLWRRFYYKCDVSYQPFIDYAWGLRLHEQAKMSAHNFAESGQADPNHPKWAKIRDEKEMLMMVYKPVRKMNFWRMLLTMDILKSIRSRVDTIRFRGKHYLECVK